MNRLFYIFIVLLVAVSANAQIAVIANKSVPVSSIERSRLLDLYSGEIKQWNDSIPVIVFDYKPKSDFKDRFYKYLGKSTARMKSIWLKLMLAGEGDPPEALKTEEEILNKVAATPGALGFVRIDKISDQVKVLLKIGP